MILKKDVEHIARLARIELTETEKAKFEKELSAILDFVAKLEEVDTSHVEPLTGGTELVNIMREETLSEQGAVSSEQGRSLTDAAPRQRKGYVEVRAVFERE